MSTLTKVLIVLQVVVALVLCGLVVTYVANADNYKQMYEKESASARKANSQKDAAQQEFEKFKATKDQEFAQLTQQLAELRDKMTGLSSTLAVLERDKAQLTDRVSTMAATIEAANASAKQQADMYQKSQEQLDTVRAQQIKKDGELKEINDSLIEKMAIITTLNEQIKRLTEEKADLQAKVEQVLRQYGKAVVPPAPASPKPTVQAAAPVAKDIALRGQITRVDMENSLAEISIGSTDGVRQEMKLYITRGDQFVCNILILDVEAQKAVGILDLVQQTPKVGDLVTTNF